jgi:hypothetical protein
VGTDYLELSMRYLTQAVRLADTLAGAYLKLAAATALLYAAQSARAYYTEAQQSDDEEASTVRLVDSERRR